MLFRVASSIDVRSLDTGITRQFGSKNSADGTTYSLQLFQVPTALSGIIGLQASREVLREGNSQVVTYEES